MQKKMNAHVDRIDGFTASQKIIGVDGETGIAVDEENNKICLTSWGQMSPYGDSLPVTNRIFLYRDILSSEIVEDGETITSTVRTSQLGGALIGGLALGGVGAIIGGLSGKSVSSQRIQRIDLRITVNDTKEPLHEINFLHFQTKKGDKITYEPAIRKARHWHGLIDVLIKRADQEDKRAEGTRHLGKVSDSLADELQKLASLRDSGVLTDSEFQSQKSRLLQGA